jgi:hypothetical protein
MAVTVVQAGSMAQWSTATASPTLAANITPGNSVILVAQSFSIVNVLTVTGCGVTWRRAIFGIANNGVSGSLDIWYGTTSTGGSPTATVTFNGGTNNHAVLLECSPIALDNAAKAENVQTGIPTTPSLTPSVGAGELFVGLTTSAWTCNGAAAPWTSLSGAGDYEAVGYIVPATAAAQQMTVAGGTSGPYSAATAVFRSLVGVKFYTSEDFGSGLQAINVLDPAGPQDVATKHYADAHTPAPFSKQVLWENAYGMVCSSNSYTGGWAGLTTGPNTQTITKLRADTGIRVKMGTTCFVNQGGPVYYGVAVNGSAIVQLFVYWLNVANNHWAMPWAEKTLWPSSYSQVGVTGSMSVNFFVSTGSGVTWNTNNGDTAYWTILEVMP